MNKANLPDPWRDWLTRVFSGEVSRFTVLFTLFSNLLVYALFAMIGGILAIAILNRVCQRYDARQMRKLRPSGTMSRNP